MKTTHLIYSTLFLFVFGSAQAQWWKKKIKGNGKMTTEMRQTDSYDAIHVHGSVHVTLTSGNEGDITIVAEENLMEYIETVHKKETLYIKTKENSRFVLVQCGTDCSQSDNRPVCTGFFVQFSKNSGFRIFPWIYSILWQSPLIDIIPFTLLY